MSKNMVSLIAAMMVRFSDRPVTSFSIGFGREGAYMNETEYASAVARRYGMAHHELILDPEDLLEARTGVEKRAVQPVA